MFFFFFFFGGGGCFKWWGACLYIVLNIYFLFFLVCVAFCFLTVLSYSMFVVC